MTVEHTQIAGRPGAADASSIGYRLLYFLGIKPWDQGRVPPELVQLIEGEDALPPGRALDLGCGGGTESIYLAQHGWQVTGVDYVARALQTARKRADAARVAAQWVRGDVTQLPKLNLGDGYTLLLDLGCFHGLNEAQRTAYAAGVAQTAARGANFLIFSFAPQFRGPAPRGLSREEIMRSLPGWELVWSRPASGMRLPLPLKRANPTFYRLRRR
ncbi:MAG: class I SAM-dependent methyltransferase [Caldilineaceae bacterium]|nr:class I SAM-dependent methyltransferase [Caldilineaceae bacterium]